MKVFAPVAAYALAASLAQAGDVPPPPISTALTDTDTAAFVGLNWTFGAGGSKAEGVIGAARVKTDQTGDSEGAKLSLHMGISGGLSFSKVKLTGMSGKSDLMGELGVGFGTDGVLATGGLWAPYLNAGVDLGFGSGLEGYAGFHTLGEWDVPPALPF